MGKAYHSGFMMRSGRWIRRWNKSRDRAHTSPEEYKGRKKKELMESKFLRSRGRGQ